MIFFLWREEDRGQKTIRARGADFDGYGRAHSSRSGRKEKTGSRLGLFKTGMVVGRKEEGKKKRLKDRTESAYDNMRRAGNTRTKKRIGGT